MEDASTWEKCEHCVEAGKACACAYSFETHTTPRTLTLSPGDCTGLEHIAHATWYFPQTPSSVSGGKGPGKHPGFIVPQKEGTNYLSSLWSAQGENRGQWGREGGKLGGGGRGGEKGERKPQDIFQSFSSNLEAGHESPVLT